MDSLCCAAGFLLYLCAVVLGGASELSAMFKATVIRTTWIASDAQLVGQLTKLKCAQKCSIANNNCFAFHLTSDGKCFLVKENKHWMEQRPIKDVTFWIKQGAPATACKALLFPESFGKSRYFYEKENKKIWIDAAAFCESKGSKLAQVSTDAERQFLWDLMNLPSKNFGFVYVGGYKNRSDGLPHGEGWKWRGSEEAFNSSLWRSGQPDNWENEQYCVRFYNDDLYLNDGGCTDSRKFICECSTL